LEERGRWVVIADDEFSIGADDPAATMRPSGASARAARGAARRTLVFRPATDEHRDMRRGPEHWRRVTGHGTLLLVTRGQPPWLVGVTRLQVALQVGELNRRESPSSTVQQRAAEA
jgi:hypothetical protein